MAKRKRTKASYYRDEYNRYSSALAAIGIKKNRPKTIKKREVERIRKRWEKEKVKYQKKTGFKPPSLKQAAKAFNKAKQENKRVNLVLEPITQPVEPVADFNLYEDIVDNLLLELDELNMWAGENGEVSFYKKGTRQYNELQEKIASVKALINDAISKHGKAEIGMIIDSEAATGSWESVISAKQGYAEMQLEIYIQTLTYLIEKTLG